MAPAVALIATDDAGSTPFVLTAIGLALTLGGNAGVSNRIAEPNYDRMLSWDPDHMPEDWQAVRAKLGASQTEFALMIGVSVATLRNWEQGRRTPDGPALALLRVAAKNPKAVANALYGEAKRGAA